LLAWATTSRSSELASRTVADGPVSRLVAGTTGQ